MVNKLCLVAPQKEGILDGNPQSLLYLAEWARRFSNYEIKIAKDTGEVPWDSNVVGISATTPTYQRALELSRHLKEKNPNVDVVLGGYHTKGQGEIIARAHPEIDFIVEGEGEKGLVSILNGQARQFVSGTPLTSEELDSISIEDLRKIDPEYFQKTTQFGRFNYSASRGCPHKCSFCASGEGRRPRAKSVENVIQDLEYLSKNGFDKISIQDNFFGYDSQRMDQICKEILARGIKIDFDCQTRVESVGNPQVLDLMKKAGCSAVYLGTENFSPEVLIRMRKTTNPAFYRTSARANVYNLLKAGIKPHFNLQVGLPDENQEIREDNIRNLDYIAHARGTGKSPIKLFAHLNVVYPGTIDFELLKARKVSRDIFESFTGWEEENAEEIKRFLRGNQFIHGAGGIPLGILDFNALREGEFKVNEEKIRQVNEYISQIKNIPGIEIYSSN